MITRKMIEADMSKHIGERIFGRRRILCLTQAKLAFKVGISHQQMQKYEDLGQTIPAPRLFRIAMALEVPVEYFYEGLPGYEKHRPPHLVADNGDSAASVAA